MQKFTAQIRAAVLFSLLFSIIAAGCGSSPAPAATNAPAGDVNTANNPTAESLSASTPAEVAATVDTAAQPAARVNDQVISVLTLDREVTRRLQGAALAGDPPPADLQQFRRLVLDSLIEQLLIEQGAAEQGVVITDEELETEVQANIELAGGRDQWLAQMGGDGMSEEEARAALRSALITQRMVERITQGVCATAEQVHARHILVADEATATSIRAALDAGQDFANLAAQWSLDVTTKQTGGDLGWFGRGQLLQPAIEDVAFSLPINGISAPVQTELGYHIVQTLEKVSDRPLEGETCVQLMQDTFTNWIAELRTNANIEILI
jgi:peptidyl-prolyl cis-trans isomerase C